MYMRIEGDDKAHRRYKAKKKIREHLKENPRLDSLASLRKEVNELRALLGELVETL